VVSIHDEYASTCTKRRRRRRRRRIRGKKEINRSRGIRWGFKKKTMLE